MRVKLLYNAAFHLIYGIGRSIFLDKSTNLKLNIVRAIDTGLMSCISDNSQGGQQYELKFLIKFHCVEKLARYTRATQCDIEKANGTS